MTTSDARNAELVGLLDPAGLGVGFMIPIFTMPLENARLIQRVDVEGHIDRFAVAEDQDTPLIPVAAKTVSFGDEAVWGFKLGDEVIACGEDMLRARLAELIETEVLRSRPMLGLEVATFLGERDIEDQYADAAMRRLTALSADGARDWRDLSILTPMLRRSLKSKFGMQEVTWVDEVYVTLDQAFASVHGMSDATDHDASTLRMVLDEVTERLPSLFERPRDGWVLRFVSDDGETEVEKPAADLWITVVGARLAKILNGAASGEALNVGVRLAEGGVPAGPRSTGIVFEARDAKAEREARLASVETRAMMIAVGTAKQAAADAWTESLTDFPYGRIDLPNVGAYQGGAIQTADAVTVRLATAVAAELAEGIYEPPHTRSVLIRALGGLSDPEALASLYGRAWAMGLRPWNAVYVAGRETESFGKWSEDVRRKLFANVKVVGGPLVRRALIGSRASGALLVSCMAASDDDVRTHASNAAALLVDRQWRVEVDDRLDEPLLRAMGDQWAFSIRVPRMRNDDSFKDDLTTRKKNRELTFDRVNVLRLVPTSSSRTMLECLQIGEFPIEMRDLARLDGGLSTIWSVVALQLRRLSSTLPSKQKTAVLGTIVQAAFSGPAAIDVGSGALIHDVLDEALGGALQLVFTHGRWKNDRLHGRLSVVEREQFPSRTPTKSFESYDLLIDAEGPRLSTSSLTSPKQPYR